MKSKERYTRHCMVNGIKKERLEEYKKVHKSVPQEVINALRVAGFRSWFIYIFNEELLISHFELISDRTVEDAFEKYFEVGGEVARRWDELTRDMQKPARGLPPGSWWTSIPECWRMNEKQYNDEHKDEQ